MDVVEPDEANETMEDLTDEELQGVFGGLPPTLQTVNSFQCPSNP